MQVRLAFNGGEFAPELDVRDDLDKYPLGCSTLENWEVGQLGGVRRRKGMRSIIQAVSSSSRIIPYVYSYSSGENLRFVVELFHEGVRVFNLDGEEQAVFVNGDELPNGEGSLFYNCDPSTVRYSQLNKLLILTSLQHRPMVLKFDGITWEFEPWEFKHMPWRYTHTEQRDTEVTVSFKGQQWNVAFDPNEENNADELSNSDFLRVSYRTERQEATAKVAELIYKNGANKVKTAKEVPQSANKGDVFAVVENEGVTRYVCISEFKSTDYIEGLESPSNYSNAFRQVDTVKGFDSVGAVFSLKDLGNIEKGAKLAIKSENWHYYTCIKTYSGLAAGFTDFKDFPEYFIEGLPVGKPIPCRGKWAFQCSGTWYGSYAVKRCYDTSELTGDWELRGVSRSYNDAAANVNIEGDEQNEECYMRLFITRSRRLGDTFEPGFPPDSCHNRLVVESYTHDIVLYAMPDSDGSKITWMSKDNAFLPEPGTRIRSKDWSWAAFSYRNGYPQLSIVYNQRLVFASTIEQPQTLWMSRTDDLDNFLEGDTNEAAINGLTLNTPTQDPICWLKVHKRALLLGTTTAEHVVEPGSTVGGITATNAMTQVHSDRGSDGQQAVSMPEKVIYVSRGGKRAYEYGYNYEADGYISRDLSLLADHIGKEHGGIVSISAIEEPDVVALFVLGDGQLALCTYNALQEVRAWHRWVTNGRIKDVCGIPNGKNDDKIFLLVERDGITWLEVVDEESGYTDGEGFDYTSTLITNIMNSPSNERVHNKESRPVAVYFGDDFPLRQGEVRVTSNGGESWYKIPDDRDFIPRGWAHGIVSPGNNSFNRRIGIQVSGDRPAQILAIQA